MKIPKFLIPLIYFCAFFIIFEALFTFVFPYVVNTQLKDEYIVNKIEGIIFDKAIVKNVKIKAYPDFSISVFADEFVLTNNGKNFLSLKKSQLRIFLPRLILGKIEIDSFNANNFKIELSRNKNGDFFLGKFKLDNNSNNLLYLDRIKINLNDYNILLNDFKLKKKTLLYGNNFEIKDFDIEKKINIYVDGKVDDSSAFCFKINSKMPLDKHLYKDKSLIYLYASNLHFGQYNDYFKIFDKNLQKIDGDLTFSLKNHKSGENKRDFIFEGVTNNFEYITKNNKENIKFTSKNKIYANFNLSKKLVNLNKFTLKSNLVDVFAKGKIIDYSNKNPDMNLEIQILNSDIKSLYSMVPNVFSTENQEIKKVKKYGCFGILNGQIFIKGKAPEPNIFGELRAKNLYILEPLPKTTPFAYLNMDFLGRKLKVYSKVYVDRTQYVLVNGIAQLYDSKSGDFKITSSKRVNLKIVHKWLLPIRDVVGFLLGPVPQMQLLGFGNIDLFAGGDRHNAILNGYFNFFDTTASFNGLNAKIEKGVGRVDFIKDKIYFKTNKASFFNQPMKIVGFSNADGVVDYNISSANVNLNSLLKSLSSSDLSRFGIKPLIIPKILSGTCDFQLKMQGKIKDFEKSDIISELIPSGTFTVKNASIFVSKRIQPIKKLFAKGIFLKDKTNFTSEFILFNSTFKLKGKSFSDEADINLKSTDLKIEDIINSGINLYFKKDNNTNNNLLTSNIKAILDLNYRGKYTKLDLNKIKAKLSVERSKGEIILKDSDLNFYKFTLPALGTNFHIDGKIINVFSSKRVLNIHFITDGLYLENLQKLNFNPVLSKSFKKVLSAYENYKGKIYVNLFFIKNKPHGKIVLKNVSFNHSQADIPVVINRGEILFGNNDVYFNSVNGMIADAPVFADTKFLNIYKNPSMKGYLTLKITDSLLNNQINTKLSYPLKLKGEVTLSADFSGNKNSQDAKLKLHLEPNAEIFYRGANLGDENVPRDILLNFNSDRNSLNIRNCEYIRYEASQNNRLYPIKVLQVKSKLNRINKGFAPKFIEVETLSNVDARLLNVIFKKSLIKSGNFNANTTINFVDNKPEIYGKMNFKNLQIPLYETDFENINLNFNKNNVLLESNGNLYNSDAKIKMDLNLKNPSELIFNNIDIISDEFNLDKIRDKLTDISYEFKHSDLIKQDNIGNLPEIKTDNISVKKGTIYAKNVRIKDLPAQDFQSNFSILNDKISLKNINFNVAGGDVSGMCEYDFATTDTLLSLNANQVDANQVTYTVFGLNNQIQGKLNGILDITTKGKSDEDRLKNLSGKSYFELKDGRMPKLGSLEYLLRAGNVIKSGITGLSINSVIDFLSPIRTGEYKSITGNLAVNNGIIKDLQIFSKGTNLSIYVKGNYNLIEQDADIRVLGKLSKKIDTLLGPLGNASINTLFALIPAIKESDVQNAKIIKDINKIPGIEISKDKYRIFTAKITGNMNSENYTSVFEWVQR